jgi:hypothetical protein
MSITGKQEGGAHNTMQGQADRNRKQADAHETPVSNKQQKKTKAKKAKKGRHV